MDVSAILGQGRCVRLAAGTTAEKIFRPWIQQMEAKGARFHFGTAVQDFKLNAAGCVTAVTGASKQGSHQVGMGDRAGRVVSMQHSHRALGHASCSDHMLHRC